MSAFTTAYPREVQTTGSGDSNAVYGESWPGATPPSGYRSGNWGPACLPYGDQAISGGAGRSLAGRNTSA